MGRNYFKLGRTDDFGLGRTDDLNLSWGETTYGETDLRRNDLFPIETFYIFGLDRGEIHLFHQTHLLIKQVDCVIGL